jgi:multidrug resistance protein, MATE family
LEGLREPPLQISVEVLSLFATTILIGWISTPALAANQIVTQYLFLILIPLMALAQAGGVLVSQACGAKQYRDVKILGQASFIFTFIITTIVASIFLLLPNTLAAAYINVANPSNAEVLHLVKLFFVIFALFQIFDGFRNVLVGLARGLFDTKFPMFVSMLSIWIIGIPLGYCLAIFMNFGAIGISMGETVGILIGAIIMAYRWVTVVKRFERKASQL